MRKGGYKSIINYRNDAPMLFDLEHYPKEAKDISKIRPDVACEFSKLIEYEARQIIKR